MTNREKYTDKIVDFVFGNGMIGIDKAGELHICDFFQCDDCIFDNLPEGCLKKRKSWLEEEYVEQPKMSKKDRDFLEYISNTFKYVIRDRDGNMYIYERKPKKGEAFWMCGGNTIGLSIFGVKLPMVKWEDEEPWSIEDLKKLDVVGDEDYCSE